MAGSCAFSNPEELARNRSPTLRCRDASCVIMQVDLSVAIGLIASLSR